MVARVRGDEARAGWLRRETETPVCKTSLSTCKRRAILRCSQTLLQSRGMAVLGRLSEAKIII